MKQLALTFVLFLPTASIAAEPAPGIRFPKPPAPPTPAQVTKLGSGQLFVITSDKPALVVASRDGFVLITALDATKDKTVVFGTFVDPQTPAERKRTYTTGWVYVVQAVATGQVELIVAQDLSGDNLTRLILDVEGPGPAPPIPPIPPVPPVDPLVKSLQDAYDKDTDPGKAIKLAALQGIMQEAASQALDPAVTTTQALGNAVHAVTEQKLGEYAKGTMKGTRDAVGIYLNANLPPLAKTPITDADRQKASAGYAKIATALKSVKP